MNPWQLSRFHGQRVLRGGHHARIVQTCLQVQIGDAKHHVGPRPSTVLLRGWAGCRPRRRPILIVRDDPGARLRARQGGFAAPPTACATSRIKKRSATSRGLDAAFVGQREMDNWATIGGD